MVAMLGRLFVRVRRRLLGLVRPLAVSLATVAAGSGTLPAAAQGLFAPAIRVNDAVVTGFELRQRALFYQILNAPGDLLAQAEKALIDERLQLQAAKAMGITVNAEQIAQGIEEFAGRANMTGAAFLAAMTGAGVARETVEDFVRAGIAWREVVSQRIAPRVQVSEAEIDRAIALSASRDSVRVLISEIVLPAQTPEQAAQARALAEELAKIDSLAAFADAARRYSAAPSAARGGRLDWMPLSNLPPAIAGQILTLAPGKVAGPIPIPGGIVLFQMRALEETGMPAERVAAIDFARFTIPEGRTEAALKEAARIDGATDDCDDLYGIGKKKPAGWLTRQTLPVEEIPAEVALELARLDRGEISTALVQRDAEGREALVVLMLCGRTLEVNEDVSREEFARILRNQRIASRAEAYLAELRADAVITYPGR
ncbi:peptidyl-prolyl cis-trans isomerase SurA [Meinhardsimonia xiamenensis]|jgi:peptidyl-prolyl cis-trans isomerase SurA|uniref:Parvulin-like PPIase n=1 Tax=Meinhardsimonia xiamenensis TaxID=990712 RepID=A0A1G9BHS0_9RHOB|nr:peptidylprolyl isomerase [Meinhardsimonia xiamenensis]PRX34995.1 periplasmic chaperone for outer membrane proteins SurA [Meinhardsimonia xiamenensis]SDK38405.1 peptidyl-prolyl cis-trans isomerase SurA [Meinhardsimonia xiamenensis]